MLNDFFPAKVRGIVPSKKDGEAGVLTIDLQYEFTQEMARGAGQDALVAQEALSDGGLTSATIPVDGLGQLHMDIRRNKDCAVSKLSSVEASKIVAKRPNAEDASPVAKVVVTLPLANSALTMLIDLLGDTVEVQMTKAQTSIPGTE